MTRSKKTAVILLLFHASRSYSLKLAKVAQVTCLYHIQQVINTLKKHFSTLHYVLHYSHHPLHAPPPPEGTPLKLEAYPPPLVRFSAMFNLRNTSSRGKPEVDQELVVECLSLVVEYVRLLVETVETVPLALVG
jgi:hypothetical protein